jgi:superoxide dismutase, Fe-Mn family
MKALEMTPIGFDVSKLKPVISEQAFNLHYNHIYKDHVDRYNKGIGDFAFDKAGAFLHSLYFENIRELRQNNLPIGKSLNTINTRYGSFERFVTTVLDKSRSLQGNGWIFMNTSGYVNLIPNNRIVDNVAMVIDCWEHAYMFNFGNDIESYIKSQLSIINWDCVNERMLKKPEKL